MRPHFAISARLVSAILQVRASRAVTPFLMVFATCQVLFRNRKDCARLDFDVLHGAGAARNVRKLGVVASRRQIADLQPFIEVDTAVLIVLTLVRTPVRSACRGEIKFRNCILGQIPESRWTLFCGGFGGSCYCEHGESHLECSFRRHFLTARLPRLSFADITATT